MYLSLWPQYTIAALILIGIGHNAARYGKPKTGSYDLSDVLFAPCLTAWLLYMGGFWSVQP